MTNTGDMLLRREGENDADWFERREKVRDDFLNDQERAIIAQQRRQPFPNLSGSAEKIPIPPQRPKK